MRIVITGFGWTNVALAVEALPAALYRRVTGRALLQGARVARRAARRRNYGFTDRTNRLRRTIRARRITGRHNGRSYKRSRAGVYAGARGARQAYLVEVGHGGPFPARPHPYLTRALEENQSAIGNAVIDEIRRLAPAALASVRPLAGRQVNVITYARTLARRGRRR